MRSTGLRGTACSATSCGNTGVCARATRGAAEHRRRCAPEGQQGAVDADHRDGRRRPQAQARGDAAPAECPTISAGAKPSSRSSAATAARHTGQGDCDGGASSVNPCPGRSGASTVKRRLEQRRQGPRNGTPHRCRAAAEARGRAPRCCRCQSAAAAWMCSLKRRSGQSAGGSPSHRDQAATCRDRRLQLRRVGVGAGAGSSASRARGQPIRCGAVAARYR
jgi:hypothetical protein